MILGSIICCTDGMLGLTGELGLGLGSSNHTIDVATISFGSRLSDGSYWQGHLPMAITEFP